MKSNKIYIVAAIILAVGMATAVVGVASVGFNLDKLSLTMDTDYEVKTYSCAANAVEKIYVKDRNCTVNILEGSGDSIELEYTDSSRYKYEIEENSGVLEIVKKMNIDKWYDYIKYAINISGGNAKTLTIKVPASYAGNFEVYTNNKEIKVASVDLADSDVNIFDTSNGAITVTDSKIAGSLKCVTSNGRINLTNIEAAGDISVDSSNGRIKAENVTSGSSLHMKTSNARIELRNVTAANTIYADTSNGGIHVEGISAQREITLDTSNAGISGTILGKYDDFTIRSDTSNGSNSLPENYGSGAIRLNVDTSNASITLEIKES